MPRATCNGRPSREAEWSFWSFCCRLSLAQLFYIRGIALIGPGRSGIFVNLIPVFAAFFAIVFLQETFEMYHAIALLLVLGGIGLSEFRKTEK